MMTQSGLAGKFHACVMAGGSGERFWPMSRNSKPKHLLKLFSEKTLLEETIDRLDGVVPNDRTFVLTNRAQVRNILESLQSQNVIQIWTEPAKRDTAPAAALATALTARLNPEGILALLPADALVKDTEQFRKQLSDAFDLAWEENALVTVAIKPSYPATGFGYLELGGDLGKGKSGSARRKVSRFIEKPSLEKAQEYLKAGNFSWNGGIFVWKVSRFREELRRLQPALADFVDHVVAADDVEKVIEAEFPNLPKISVDYAIMEKVDNVCAVESQFDWDDVGAWTSLVQHFGKDDYGNTTKGVVVSHDSSDNIAIGGKRVIALCGVKDLVVIETDDAILVAHKDSVQDIKKLQPKLPSNVL